MPNKTLTAALSLLTSTVVFATAAQAQATRFSTYTSREFVTAEGTFKLPFAVGKPDSKQFDDYQRVTKDYTNYMAELASDYMGYDRECTVDSLLFLPGETESAFRRSEKELNSTLTGTGYRRSSGETGKLLTMKSMAPKTLSKDLTGSFYIYKPSVYPRNSDLKTHYVYGYFFNKKLSQGNLIVCSFFARK